MGGTNVGGKGLRCMLFSFCFSFLSKQARRRHSKPRRECGKPAAATFASFVYLCSRRLRQF